MAPSGSISKCFKNLFRKSVLTLIAVFSFGIYLLPNSSFAEETLFLSTGATPPWGPDNKSSGFLEAAATEAFKRIGVKVNVEHLPPERVLVNVNNGRSDGDVFRIAGMEKNYPNLIIVPEPIAEFQFDAFTLAGKPPESISGFSDLEPYAVGLVRGWKFYENRVTSNTDTTILVDQEGLLKMLKAKRLDVILLERWMAAHAAKKIGVKIRRVKPPFAKFPMYFYLNKKHSHLVPKVAAAIAEMKADGALGKLRDEFLGVLEK